MKFAADAAKYMPNVEIIEKHHEKKLDSPSGTAIKTAELIANANQKINQHKVKEQMSLHGARGGKVKKYSDPFVTNTWVCCKPKCGFRFTGSNINN